MPTEASTGSGDAAQDHSAAAACDPLTDYELWQDKAGYSSTECLPLPAACVANVRCACVLAALGLAANYPDWTCKVAGGFVVVSGVANSGPP